MYACSRLSAPISRIMVMVTFGEFWEQKKAHFINLFHLIQDCQPSDETNELAHSHQVSSRSAFNLLVLDLVMIRSTSAILYLRTLNKSATLDSSKQAPWTEISTQLPSTLALVPPLSESPELVSAFLVAWMKYSLNPVKMDASIFAGAGIGTVFGSLVIGYARNPGLKQQLFSYAILGFALSEAMGLFCLMMAFMLLFAF